MLSQLFMTLYPTMYNITPSIFMISYLICTLSPYCFHENTTTIPDISPSIFNNTATVPVSDTHSFHDITPMVYMKSHPLYLIPQPLHLYGHTHAIDAITKIMEVISLGTHMILYTLYIISHSPFMTSILGIYDITNTAFMTSDLLYMTLH